MERNRRLIEVLIKPRAFIRGIGSILDISGNSFRPPRIASEEEAFDADRRAIATDWENVIDGSVNATTTVKDNQGE